MHFVGNEGSNFGLTGSGEFSESVENLNKYQVEAPKYRKEYIDRARLDVAQEREKNKWDTALNQKFPPRFTTPWFTTASTTLPKFSNRLKNTKQEQNLLCCLKKQKALSAATG